MKKEFILAACIMLLVAGIAYATDSIKNTPHDLSSTSTFYTHGSAGKQQLEGTLSTQICIYCHTPHNAQAQSSVAAPLWNHKLSTASSYTPYTSASMNGDTSSGPGGVSKACLTCHDGTIAVDAYLGHNGFSGAGPGNNGTGADGSYGGTGGIIFNDSGTDLMSAVDPTANLGTDLSNDHPVGFTVVDDGELNAVVLGSGTAHGTIGTAPLPLYGSDGNHFECASCHAVHDNSNKPFLRMANTSSALCLNCHIK